MWWPACDGKSAKKPASNAEEMRLAGTISWPGFGAGGEDWFGFIFRIEQFRGTAFTENAEGTLEWVEVERVMELPLWEGDRHFLPLYLQAARRRFTASCLTVTGDPFRGPITSV